MRAKVFQSSDNLQRIDDKSTPYKVKGAVLKARKSPEWLPFREH